MNDTTAQEQVLVIPRTLFMEHEEFHGFKKLNASTHDLGVYLQGAPRKNASFMDRDKAEESPFHKQIIPYIVILSEDSVFMYRRGEVGSEQRLHGKYSIGVGGHINLEDGQEPWEAFYNAVVREAKEEVGLTLNPDMLEGAAIGLVNDESSAVGRVHLGVVIAIKVSNATAKDILKNCEDTLLEPQWIPLYELENPGLSQRFETWSKFVADHFIKEASEGGKWDDKAFRERITMLAIAASNLAASASGFLLQESPRGHVLSKKMVEEAAGETQCLLAGLVAWNDVEGHEIKKNAKGFHEQLGEIAKHQPIVDKEIIEKIPPQ